MRFLFGFLLFFIQCYFAKEWNLDLMYQFASNNLTLGFDDHGLFNPDNLLSFNESQLIEKDLANFSKEFYVFPYIYIINKLESKDLSDEYLYNLTDSLINKLEKKVMLSNKDYTVIFLLIANDDKMFIYTGKSLSKKIIKENCDDIINSLSNDIKNKNYGKALQYGLYYFADFYEESLFLDEIEEKKSKKGKDPNDELIDDNNKIENEEIGKNIKKEEKFNNYYIIFIIIIGILFVLLIFTVYFCLKLAKKLRNVSSSQIDYNMLKI